MLCDCVPERASLTKSCFVIGCPSGPVEVVLCARGRPPIFTVYLICRSLQECKLDKLIASSFVYNLMTLYSPMDETKFCSDISLWKSLV